MPELTEPSVLIAHDLAPADTAGLSPVTTLAIVTELGGPTSHTAILAAQLGIPAVVHVRRRARTSRPGRSWPSTARPGP